MRLADRLLGDPHRLDATALRERLRVALRAGAEGWTTGALRRLALLDREAGPDLGRGLEDPHAAVRRAAAWGLGAMPRLTGVDSMLEAAFLREHTEEGRVQIGVAWARQGGDPGRVRAALERWHGRVLETCGGPRQPSAVLDVASPVQRFDQAFGEGAPLGTLRAARTARLSGDDARAMPALWDLAALGHPDDVEVLTRQFGEAGRRGEHGLLVALGLHGDARHVPALEDALTSARVDPGRGFVWRRLAATSLGQIGLRASGALLRRALVSEALDFEGRPGAGLGIQYPVRTNLLVALGELGDVAAAPELVSYLGNTHGSALGGFYLPAADALCRLGPAAVPAIHAGIQGAPEVLVANAVGVLGALGEDVRAWSRDARPQVAEVARRWCARVDA